MYWLQLLTTIKNNTKYEKIYKNVIEADGVPRYSNLIVPKSKFFKEWALGRFFLVVTMIVRVCICLSVCPLPMRFFLRPLIGPQVT